MDASHSPLPANEGEEDSQTGGRETGESDSPAGNSILSWLFGGPPAAPEPVGRLNERLGPAFAGSNPAELAMIQNILRLRDLRIDDVMTPRADVMAVSETADLAAVIAMFERGSFSRLPVFRETLDDPIGFVHLKDIALSYGVGCEKARRAFRLTDHLHKALFVPPSMRIVSLLQRMQAERVHMALVIDEFGGVDGLVTIEDLVEQIVGEIEDEHDHEEQADWVEETPGVFVVNARTDILTFEAETGIALRPEEWEEEVDTLGGLVFTLANRVPTRGEVIMHPFGHEIVVVDGDPRRIKRLRLTVAGAAETTTAAANAAE